jgi:trimethylamine corrinoid protein
MSIFDEITQSIVDGNKAEATNLANKAIETGIEPLEATDALTTGINIVGDKFAKGEFYLPELIISAEAMKEAVGILDAEIKKRGGERKQLGKVVVGTIEGDIHDIGKTIVASLLSAGGFEVFDLGVDVSADSFIAKIKEVGADILGMSALLTTTMTNQATTIQSITEAGLRDRVKIMIGGAPASSSWAEEIGSDGYGQNAIEATELAKNLLQSE